MNVLSIQSGVVYGHVGNSTAQFCLQRLGHEVWRIDTVRFSNHPGHGGLVGAVADPAEIAALVGGVAARGWLADCDALLTGYLGAAEQGPAILEAAERLRAANPRARWLLDPVIGDNGRVFVKPGIPEFMRDRAVPRADILTPNAFELGWLAGMQVTSVDSAIAAARALRPRAEAIVVATGVPDRDDRLTTVAVQGDAAWAVTTPRVPVAVSGTGDSFAAILLGKLLDGDPIDAALAHATSAVCALLRHTAERQAKEIELIAAQEAIVAPSPRFAARRLT